MPKKIRKLAAGDYLDYGMGGDFANDSSSNDGGYYDNSSDGVDYSGGGSSGYGSSDLSQNNSSLEAFKAVQARQQNALQALKDAQARAVASLQPKQDKSAMWLAVAQGLLSPTRTGSFGESLGNAAGGAAPYAQHYADANVAARQGIANMDYGLAQAMYQDAMKPPQIIDWYARNADGTVGKQKALVVNGQPIPFGEVLTPRGAGSNMKANLDLFADPKYGPLLQKYMQMSHPANQSVTNVTNSVPYESQDQKNAADFKKTLAEEANKSLQLSSQLNAVLPEMQKLPNAYFGPGGEGLVWAGKAMKQMGFDVGDNVDKAGFVQAIMNHLGPAQRIIGSGSSSDRDVQLFMGSLPGLMNTKEGNIALVKYYSEMAQFNRKLLKIYDSAAKRGDYYALDDQAQKEINDLGSIFTPDEKAELQKYQGGTTSSSNKKLPRGGTPFNLQDNGDTITISPVQ